MLNKKSLLLLLVIFLYPTAVIYSGEKSAADDQDTIALDIESMVVPADLMEGVPADFTRFYFAGSDKEAQLMNRYLWYHFSTRVCNCTFTFNKEYMLTSDIWLGGAVEKATNRRIQEIHRQNLQELKIDDDGYVQTHQHFSFAHDSGWPFPIWTSAATNVEGLKGKTAGWHFQDLANIPHWVGDTLRSWKNNNELVEQFCGATAAEHWELVNLRSLGIVDQRWHMEATGRSPEIITPPGVEIDAFNAPYLQLRWKRTGSPPGHALPYIEWLGENDSEFSPQRRAFFYLENKSSKNDLFHSIAIMYQHPQWTGKIKRIRIALAPGEADVKFEIDSFFTVYDTRHTINNPIFILASCRYFDWTGDIDFLRLNINRMRTALRYQQRVMQGLKLNHIRNPWPGHDGLPGFYTDEKGQTIINAGHGIGSNYWDILPFGWDDLYATNQYYAATLALADLEKAINDYPDWDIPAGESRFDPEQLRQHARQVKETANKLFWNTRTGRFIACIDKEGARWDYGFTFVNLDTIWYQIASDKHARTIMDWITGKRIVKGDTSTGADIYHWRFGPRASTVRNLKWYGQSWFSPQNIPWGMQVQDGGAVLGFSFYDLWARLSVLGPDNAWERLVEIMQWDDEVHQAGGYRQYYQDPNHEGVLQGAGTLGGLGIDMEFFESSLVPAIVTYGFMGLKVINGDTLYIDPQLPQAVPIMGVKNLFFHGFLCDILVKKCAIEVNLRQKPVTDVKIGLAGPWKNVATGQICNNFSLTEAGIYRFEKNQTRD